MERLSTHISIGGLARGTALFYPDAPAESFSESSESPLETFRSALSASCREIEGTVAEGTLSEILSAHLEMLSDPLLTETVEADIRKGMGAREAVEAASEEISAMFEALDDEYLRSRKDDVRDVCRRIIRNMASPAAASSSDPEQDVIVVAAELFPSDTVRMDFSRVRGFVLEKGSVTSHVAILARGYGIPVLFGIPVGNIHDGDRLLVDGNSGELIINPDAGMESHFSEKLASFSPFPEAGEKGECPVKVYANAGSIAEVRKAMENGADGVGLFRSEFLYMKGNALPTEDEQYETYAEAARLCGEKPLTIRTLDIGGDKALPYLELPREDNPFLGFRAIRISLARPELFRTQIRAILRSSAHGRIRILLPMITRVEEVLKAKEIISLCMKELDGEHLPYDPEVEIGVMVETPASVLIAEELAKEVDFFSVGTNDLTQYVMVADRGNSSVASYYDVTDPAVMRALSIIANAAAKEHIPVGICGEAASDAKMQPLLLEIGFSSLSVPASLVRETRRNIMAIHKK